MDYPTFFILMSFLLACIHAFSTLFSRRNSRLPPGPYAFPIIGNLLKLGGKPHQSLATLSKCYGPLMSLKLGSLTTIVVSSPHIAKVFFHTHDRLFSSRAIPEAARVVDHHKFSIVWLPAGDQWRRLRRITKEYLFSMQCIDATELLRKEKVRELLEHVDRCCKNGRPVNVGEVAFTTILNIFSNVVFSTDFAGYDSVSSQVFKDNVRALMEVGGKPNVVDYFPILQPLDPQGLTRWVYACGKKLLTIFDEIIDQRTERMSNLSLHDDVLSSKNDVLESLLRLNLKDESEFSRNDMRHFFLDLFMAGTDTISSTLEWAMAELIRNPEKMETARLELVKFTQNRTKNIHEEDISQLPYLQATIKETFRLHPPAPFLIPHQAIQNVDIQGFIVPKNAQILCNVWAMGRDPDIWPNPEVFMPERFLDVEIDFKGQDFELIPFGTGRRICPGLNFAHRMLHIVLGSLIQNYDWRLERNKRPYDLDMGEKFGLTLQRNVPLMAIPIKL
uniref:cytochrome P450 76T24-like n=1 Tax=Erigeron canadensis TaxID=72917 RepID=UPI001CB9A33B|nr:cytochrome P450 76T24-like [Erigeron canadensis]